MWNYIYMIGLLLIIIEIYLGMILSIKYAPIKIRRLNLLIFIFIFLRYITLLVFLLVDDIKYVYYLEQLTYLNFIYIPIISYMNFCIAYRNTKIKIKNSYYIFLMLISLYLLFIFKFENRIMISNIYGYSVIPIIPVHLYILLATGIFMFIVGWKSYEYPYSTKKSIIFNEIANVITIITILLMLYEQRLLGTIIISEIIWLIGFNLNLYNFKENLK